ncbi:MAG: DPP IV N-terminal domain-containing protein [Candidatus Omnitrophica bacterium]|nr:DPP IV N-terminal domain-containing protein [Candidatus Omnitrophota bacterium]
MKRPKLLVVLAVYGLFISLANCQKQYIIYSQTELGTGHSSIIRYDTATGETIFVTGFPKTDTYSILSVSAHQDQIYFTRASLINGRPNSTIWRIYIDGSGLTDFLSPDTEISYRYVAVSPDGKTVAYVANTRESPFNFHLYICNSDGTNTRRLTFDPTWNCAYPVFINNDTIVFRVTKDQLQDYYTATTSGVLSNLTNNDTFAPYFSRLGRPVVNYSGNAIIYAKQVQEISGYRKWAIYKLSPVDGTGVEELLTDFLYFAESDPLLQEEPYPAFYGSNDNQIVFCGSLAGNVYDLYSVNIPIVNPYLVKLTDGPYHISLPVTTEVPAVPQRYVYLQGGYVYVRDQNGAPVRLTAGADNRHPAINRRGTMVAFASSNGIYVIRPNGAGLVQLESNTFADYPEFSPDGLWVLYVKNGDIYAKRIDNSSGARLTYTGNVAGDIRFSPSGQEIVFTGFVSGKKHIFICPVQISYDQPMTIISGVPRDITPSTSENYQASFSPDGNKIVFVTTRNQVPELWLMNKNGTGQRKIMFSSSPQNPANPCFSTYSSDIIYYIAGIPQRIYIADISQQFITPVPTGYNADHMQVSNIPAGAIEAERFIGIKERDPYIAFTYHLAMHIDKIPLPNSAILTEVIPDGWTLTGVKINGIVPVQMTSNGATTGQLKWIFGPAGIAPLQDSVLQITIENVNPGSETYGEFRGFGGWTQTTEKIFTRGNSAILIANPFIPVDTDYDWKISDEELLYAIFLWSINGRISMWPEDLSEWDFQLLSTISFWANPQGYTYDLTNSRGQGKYLWKKQ